MRSRRRKTVLGSAFFAIAMASVLAIPAGAAASEERQAAAEIQEFVDRVDDKYGIAIDSADYELRRSGGDTFILPKGAETPQVKTARHKGKTKGEPDSIETRLVPASPASPPTPAEAARMEAAGDVTIMQDTVWYEPDCMQAELADPDDAGRLLGCHRWGDMNYAGQTRNNWAFHIEASCWPGGANFKEVTECYTDTVKASNSAPLIYNGHSPRSTVNLDNCGTFTLGLSVGPVNAGSSHNSCGQIVPELGPGSPVGDLRTRMIDDIYYTTEVREVAHMLGLGVAFGQTGRITYFYGYYYQDCTPGNPLYWCG